MPAPFEFLDPIADGFEALLPKLERRVFDVVDDILGGLDVAGGVLESNQDLTAALGQVDKAVTDALREGGYVRQATEYVNSLRGLPQANVDNMLKLTGLSVDIELLSAPMQAAINRAALEFGHDFVTQQLITPIKGILATSITSSASVPAARASLKEFIQGIGNDGGRFSRYVNTIARDVVYAADGAMAQVIIDDYGLNAIRYIGSLVADSRTQCRKWSRMPYILLKDLPAEVAYAAGLTGYGSGKTLTVTNFATIRGGWNCRHIVIPIRVEV